MARRRRRGTREIASDCLAADRSASGESILLAASMGNRFFSVLVFQLLFSMFKRENLMQGFQGFS